MVRTLDEEAVQPPDRLRLLALYLLYKDGLLPADLSRLRAHAQLAPNDEDVIRNLELLGARVARVLKDKTPAQAPLFPPKGKPPPGVDLGEYALSRYETNLKQMLEAHGNNTLDTTTFPYTKPHLSADENDGASISAASLRSAKPTWARGRGGGNLESRQRVIVFAAGGATYSEARECYEVGEKTGKEIFLVSSHMLTPGLWMRQVGDLSADRRKLGLPSDGVKPKTPAWVFEQEPDPMAGAGTGSGSNPYGAPAPQGGAMQAAARASPAAASRATKQRPGGLPQGPGHNRAPSVPKQPPASEMARMNLGQGSNGTNGSSYSSPASAPAPAPTPSSGKLHKKDKGEKEEKEKKKHKMFGLKK